MDRNEFIQNAVLTMLANEAISGKESELHQKTLGERLVTQATILADQLTLVGESAPSFVLIDNGSTGLRGCFQDRKLAEDWQERMVRESHVETTLWRVQGDTATKLNRMQGKT